MGESYHMLPWATLKYDATRSGYVVDLNKAKLEGAPFYGRDVAFNWTPDYGRKVDDFYQMPSNWN